MLGGFKHEENLGIVWFFHEVGPIWGIDKDNRRSLHDSEKDYRKYASLYAKLASPRRCRTRSRNVGFFPVALVRPFGGLEASNTTGHRVNRITRTVSISVVPTRRANFD